MSILKMSFPYLMTIALIYLFSIGGTGCTADSAPVTNDQISPAANNGPHNTQSDLTDDEILSLNKKVWSQYASTDEASRNFLRHQHNRYRVTAFKRALISYWFVNNRFPDGDNPKEIIRAMNELNLLPFWPLDPVNLQPMKIVDDPALIFSWSDVFIEKAQNGAFDYVMELRYPFAPFDPYVDEVIDSVSLGSLKHEIYVPDSGYSDPIQNPSDVSDAFRDMTMAWFMQLLKASFKESGGTVPATLAELLKGKVAINTDSWGHPAGGVEDGMPGDFEFGVDPVENGYYIYNVDSNGNSHDIEFIFYKSEINGDMIYDLRSEDHYIQRVFHQLKNRIPLLSDESFSEPFDFSGYQTVTLADVIGPDMVSQNAEVSSGGIQSD